MSDFWWGVVGNLVASAIAFTVGGVVGYAWKRDIEGWFHGLHDRHDALESRLDALTDPTSPRHGATGVMPAVTE